MAALVLDAVTGLMCVACQADPSCEHALKDCAAIAGEYCIFCHHHSSMPSLARRKVAMPIGPRRARPSMSALLREIRQRRRRRRA